MRRKINEEDTTDRRCRTSFRVRGEAEFISERNERQRVQTFCMQRRQTRSESAAEPSAGGRVHETSERQHVDISTTRRSLGRQRSSQTGNVDRSRGENAGQGHIAAQPRQHDSTGSR